MQIFKNSIKYQIMSYYKVSSTQQECPTGMEITTYSECETACSSLTYGMDDPVGGKSYGNRMPYCIWDSNTDKQDCDFNLDFNGNGTDTYHYAICKQDLSCDADYECDRDNQTEYCVSNVCTDPKPCTTNAECYKTGYCSGGYCAECDSSTNSDCIGLYYGQSSDIPSSCATDHIIYDVADCMAACNTFGYQTGFTDGQFLQTNDNRALGCHYAIMLSAAYPVCRLNISGREIDSAGEIARGGLCKVPDSSSSTIANGEAYIISAEDITDFTLDISEVSCPAADLITHSIDCQAALSEIGGQLTYGTDQDSESIISGCSVQVKNNLNAGQVTFNCNSSGISDGNQIGLCRKGGTVILDSATFCQNQCAALGHCCSDYTEGSYHYLSCSHACMIREAGTSQEVCEELCPFYQCSYNINSSTYNTCGSCSDEPSEGGSCTTTADLNSNQSCMDGCSLTQTPTCTAAVVEVPTDIYVGQGVWCADQCQSQNLCCLDYTEGCDNYLSCSQACMIRQRGTSQTACEVACKYSESSYSINGFDYSTNGSDCSDIDNPLTCTRNNSQANCLIGCALGTTTVIDPPYDLLNPAEDDRFYSTTQGDAQPGETNASSQIDSSNQWLAAVSDQNQWMILDAGQPVTIQGIFMQGRTDVVTQVKLSYSDDASTWLDVDSASTFDAQTAEVYYTGIEASNPDKKYFVELLPSITARYLRVTPWAWQSQINLRAGLAIDASVDSITCSTINWSHETQPTIEAELGSTLDKSFDVTLPDYDLSCSDSCSISSVSSNTYLNEFMTASGSVVTFNPTKVAHYSNGPYTFQVTKTSSTYTSVTGGIESSNPVTFDASVAITLNCGNYDFRSIEDWLTRDVFYTDEVIKIYVPQELELDADGTSYTQVCSHDDVAVSLTSLDPDQTYFRLKYTGVSGEGFTSNTFSTDSSKPYEALIIGRNNQDLVRVQDIGNWQVTLSQTTDSALHNKDTVLNFEVRPDCASKSFVAYTLDPSSVNIGDSLTIQIPSKLTDDSTGTSSWSDVCGQALIAFQGDQIEDLSFVTATQKTTYASNFSTTQGDCISFSTTITSFDECEQQCREHGLSIYQADYWGSDRPPGCFWDTAQGSFWFFNYGNWVDGRATNSNQGGICKTTPEFYTYDVSPVDLADVADYSYTVERYLRGSEYLEYRIQEEKVTFDNADQICQDWGGSLVILNNQEAFDRLFQYTDQPDFWIGLRRTSVGVAWQWVDSTDFTDTFWRSGEPSDGSDELCAGVITIDPTAGTFEWDDDNCTSTLKNFICQRTNQLKETIQINFTVICQPTDLQITNTSYLVDLQGQTITFDMTGDPIVIDVASTQTPACEEPLIYEFLWDGIVVTEGWILQTNTGFELSPQMDQLGLHQFGFRVTSETYDGAQITDYETFFDIEVLNPCIDKQWQTEEFPTELTIGASPTEVQLLYTLETGLYDDPTRSWSEVCGSSEIYFTNLPSFVTLLDGYLKFSPQSVAHYGDFQFEVVKIGSSLTTTQVQEISISTTLDCQDYTFQPLQELQGIQTFEIVVGTTREFTIPIDLTEDSSGESWSQICGQAELSETGAPTFVTLDGQTLIINPSLLKYIGTYSFSIEQIGDVTQTIYFTFSVTCDVESLRANYETGQKAIFDLQTDEPIILPMPQFIQSPSCAKDVVVLPYVNGKSSPTWITMLDDEIQIFPNITVSGVQEISLYATIIDQTDIFNWQKSPPYLTLDVIGHEEEEDFVPTFTGVEICDEEEEECDFNFDLPAPRMYLHESTQYGLIKLKFTQNMIIPINLLSSNAENPFLLIEMIRQHGSHQSVEVGTVKGASSRRLQADYKEFYERTITFEWEMVDLQKDSLDIQIDFSNPLLVSTNGIDKDKLRIKMNRENAIFSSISRKPVAGDFEIDFKLPPQFPTKEEADIIVATGIAAQAVAGMNIILLIIIQLLVGKAIKKILPLFFTLQFVLSFRNFKETMLPPSVNSILESITDALELNAIPKEEIQAYIFPSDLGEQLFKSGGNLLLLLPLVFGFVLLIVIFGVCFKKVACCKKILDKIKDAMFFNGIFGSLLPMILPFCITAGFGRHLNDTPSEVIGNPVMMGAILAFLFGFIFFVRTHQVQKLILPKTKQKFGILYQSYRFENFDAACYLGVFILRRIFFVTLMQISIFSLRLGLNLLLQLAIISYLRNHKPFADTSLQITYIVNEWLLTFIFYLLPIYTYIIPFSTDRNTHGWYFIFVIGIMMAYNFFNMTFQLIKDVIAKKKANKAREEWQKKQIEISNLRAKNEQLKSEIKKEEERQRTIVQELVRQNGPYVPLGTEPPTSIDQLEQFSKVLILGHLLDTFSICRRYSNKFFNTVWLRYKNQVNRGQAQWQQDFFIFQKHNKRELFYTCLEKRWPRLENYMYGTNDRQLNKWVNQADIENVTEVRARHLKYRVWLETQPEYKKKAYYYETEVVMSNTETGWTWLIMRDLYLPGAPDELHKVENLELNRLQVSNH